MTFFFKLIVFRLIMRFVLIPSHSLERMALVKIVITLWNQDGVRALIAKCSFQPTFWITNDVWKEIEKKVSHLPLPQLFRETVLGYIRSVGLQIETWFKFHSVCYGLPFNLPLQLCWTAQGTVDRKRTAEALVKDESLDISTRYKIACIYCLEDDIIALWNTLPEDLKQSFLCKNPPNISKSGEKWIISFWSRTVKRRGLNSARTSYKYGFQHCAYRGNKAAAEYFLQKLTPREREESLVEAAKSVYDRDTLCFLISEMDEQQQMEVFKKDPLRVLGCFLQWPWQSSFIEIASCMWDFISKDDYENVLTNIIYKVRDGYKDCNYQKLFREFWLKSPEALKSWIANDSLLLPHLFHIKDKENIRLILKDSTHTAREKLIYSCEMHCFCRGCIHDEEWDFLEFFIRECFPSKNLMLKFKEQFEKCKKRKRVKDNVVRNKQKWDRLFLSSDDSLCEYEKRNEDEGESSSSKRDFGAFSNTCLKQGKEFT